MEESIDKNINDPEVQEEFEKDNESNLIEDTLREDKNAIPYVTASTCTPLGTLVPTKLAIETYDALRYFLDNKIDTTEFVRKKLNYTSRLAVCNAFGAEQVDAIALAILQLERNKGMIVGDMAGIGKGRICAGILRYAHVMGKIPVFVTLQPNLFSDIYRDIIAIGGFGAKKNLPVPFILNPKQGSEDPSIKDPEGVGEDIKILFEAKNQGEVVDLCLKKKMPSNHDVVMVTYSQLQFDATKEGSRSKNATAKYQFLEAVAPESIYVMDEAHTGSGTSLSGEKLRTLTTLANGCVFASATYAKTPRSMTLYIPKTDIADSTITPALIESAIHQNGEIVLEYIASQLVASGQMIRRERSYDGIDINYFYYTEPEKIKYYYGLYDKIIEIFNRVRKFGNSFKVKQATQSAIERIAKDYRVELVDPKDATEPSDEDEKKKWKQRNKDKYTVKFNNTRLLRNRFRWIENLLFCIKADMVADQVLECLSERAITPVEYTFGDQKVIKEVNYKPVIAVRDTVETFVRDLGYKIGDKIQKKDNDYAKTLIGIVNSLIIGEMTFIPVIKGKKEILVEDATVIDADFNDDGAEYKEIVRLVQDTESGIPLSPIDHIIDKIQSTPRNNKQKEFTSTPTYRVEEITKRSVALRKSGDAFVMESIPKESKVNKVKRFNAGLSDVVILNTAGSTGLSIHSSIDKEFIDKRPRRMFIHQVELDVNEEVQKRGRINRTGQVNKPAYTYIVSPIPNEIRKLLMLRKKLRTLDANTSGNVKQSAKASEIRDAMGNEIQDFYNKYGYDILLAMHDDPRYAKFWKTDEQKKAWNDKKSDGGQKLDVFVRDMEIFSSEDQLEFFNVMNELYTAYKADLENRGEFDIEVSLDDLKASVLNKRILFSGSDRNKFTQSVFIEDKYITPKTKPLTKKELERRIAEQLKGEEPQDYMRKLMDEFYEYEKKQIQEAETAHPAPDVSEVEDEDERKRILEEHDIKVAELVAKTKEKLMYLRKMFIFFRPAKIVSVPQVLDSVDDDWKERRQGIPMVNGKFIGYRISSKSKNKFTGMNIEMMFATLSKLNPYFTITATPKYKNIIDIIMANEVTSPRIVAEVNEWVIKDKSERSNMRVLTGEIFKAFGYADQLIDENNNYEGRPRLIKYTNADGSVESGVKLRQIVPKLLTQERETEYFEINSEKAIEFMRKNKIFLNNGVDFIQYNVTTEDFRVNICTSKRYGAQKRIKGLPVSRYDKDKQLENLRNVSGVQNQLEWYSMEIPVVGRYIYSLEYNVFKCGEVALKAILDYFWKEEKMSLAVSGGVYVVKDAKDVDVQAEEAGQGKKGAYFYYPLQQFDPNSKPPNFVGWEETPDSTYGRVTVSFLMSPIAARSYGYVPVNVEKGAAIRNFMTMIPDVAKKQEFLTEVKNLKEDYLEVGLLAEQFTSNLPLKYSFGRIDTYSAGEIIAEYAQDPTKYDAEVIEEKDEAKAVIIPISFESAQDFLIKMKSL